VWPGEISGEVLFYDAGQLVYHEQTRLNQGTKTLVNRPSAAWDAMQQGRFSLNGNDVFSRASNGSMFSLWNPVRDLEKFVAPVVGPAVEFVKTGAGQVFRNAQQAFSGIEGLRHAIDVNARTLDKDFRVLSSAIDFGKLSFPKIDIGRLAGILHDLIDRTPWGLQGRYLDEFNAFLAEEGQKVYQSHLDADGDQLDSGGHAGLQQAAAAVAQARLLARYGLNPDGSRMLPGPGTGALNLRGSTGSFSGDNLDRSGRRSENPDGTVRWDFEEPDRFSPTKFKTEPPTRKKNPERSKPPERDTDSEPDPPPRWVVDAQEAALRREAEQERIRVTRETVRATFAPELARSTGTQLAAYATHKGKQVADFGATTYGALEAAVIKSINEWEQASPEGRARMLGTLAGQVATEAVLGGVAGKIAGRAVNAATLGRKTKTAVDKTTSAPGFAAHERKVRAAAGKNHKNPQAVRNAHDKVSREALAAQLRNQAGMDPEHARRLAEFAKSRKQLVIVRSSNPKSLQYHGKKGHAAKPGDLGLRTTPRPAS